MNQISQSEHDAIMSILEQAEKTYCSPRIHINMETLDAKCRDIWDDWDDLPTPKHSPIQTQRTVEHEISQNSDSLFDEDSLPTNDAYPKIDTLIRKKVNHHPTKSIQENLNFRQKPAPTISPSKAKKIAKKPVTVDTFSKADAGRLRQENIELRRQVKLLHKSLEKTNEENTKLKKALEVSEQQRLKQKSTIAYLKNKILYQS